ncbi:MAG: hypothetical protein RI894_619 [Bacteroidota bacterium]|jgi:hypothetical protein
MKKKNLAFLLPLVFATSLFAQNTERYTALSARDYYAKAPSFVSLFGNYSMLLNTNYTKTDYANNAAGFSAGSGWNAGVQGCYYFSPNFGIGGLGSYSMYDAASTENLTAGYRSSFNAPDAAVTAKNGYTMWNALGGLFITIPVESVSFDFRGLGGYASMDTPEMEINLNNSASSTSPIVQRRGTGGGLAWMAGAGLRVHFSDAFSMGLHGDYFSATPDIDINYARFPITTLNARRLTTYKETFNSLNVGLAFYFNFEQDRY